LQKLEAENALLQEQLATSHNTLVAMNARMTELKAEKDAAVQVRGRVCQGMLLELLLFKNLKYRGQ
jgi:hypothetical protein